MNAPKRLTDAAILAAIKQVRSQDIALIDSVVPGLSLRLYLSGRATWTQFVRVVGEGGVNRQGKKLVGKKHRLNLGTYPDITIEAARAQANLNIDQAKRGINPKHRLETVATAGSVKVQELSEKFLTEYVRFKELDSAWLYEKAFKTHINPIVASELAELLTREDIRKVMNAARVKRAKPGGGRGPRIGGIEASRTAMRVLRHMFSWALEEGKLKRLDNPAKNIIKNLPKGKKGETVLSLQEARIVWAAARDCGYPFGVHAQLMLLTGCRLDEWASAENTWIDLDEALMVIPAKSYKSDHAHVVPLVPEALQILRAIPALTTGPYLLSSRGGSVPIQGVSKFFKTCLASQIVANTGAPFPKRLTSHVLRRTVATRLAEQLGEQGDQLVKRVLGHSDGSVTAIYNRYGYVREMRRILEIWANELTADAQTSSVAADVTGPVTPAAPKDAAIAHQQQVSLTTGLSP